MLIKEKKKKEKGPFVMQNIGIRLFSMGELRVLQKKKELIVLRNKSEKCLFKNGTKKYLN